MKKLIFYFVVLLSNITCYGQLKLIVNSLTISSIVDTNSYELEGSDGPYLSFDCDIINSSNDNVCIYPFRDSLYIVFYYKNVKYIRSQVSFQLHDKSLWILAPNDSIHFITADNLLLGTDLLRSWDFDYTEVLLHVLPTISVELKLIDKNVRISNDVIKEVKVL